MNRWKMLFLAVVSLSCLGCANTEADTATISFDTNTILQTNQVKSQTVKKGSLLRKPNAFVSGENPDGLALYRWCTSKTLEQAWDFAHDIVSTNMTLYADWEPRYEVSYYLGDAKEPVKTVKVFKGNLAKEYPDLALGYHYYGTFLDPDFTKPFDFSTPITGNTSLYLKRSDGIFLGSEAAADDAAVSGYLYDNIEIKNSSGDLQEGWTEQRTLANGEKATYVNFGNTPTLGDAFFEINLPLDIRYSQILEITFKNLGPCQNMCIYFTSMLDDSGKSFSLTGRDYSQTYCVYPSHGVGESHSLPENQVKMGEDDPWTVARFDLSSICSHGYSVWGTSPYLGSLRVQCTYQSQGKDDFSNAFLFQKIEGIYQEIVTDDSTMVKSVLGNDDATELAATKAAQESQTSAFLFPKDDAELMPEETKLAQTYEKKEGLLVYHEKVIGVPLSELETASLSFDATKKAISLGELPTLVVRIKNLGYLESLVLTLYNDEGDLLTTELALTSQDDEFVSYPLNLMGKPGMYGNLTKLSLSFEAQGVDNAFLLSSLSFQEFKVHDIEGINFNDRKSWGFVSSDEAKISYDQGREASKFEILTESAVLENLSPKKGTNEGYASQRLNYILPEGSNVSEVRLSYCYEGNSDFSSEYCFTLDTANANKKTKSLEVPFVMSDRGRITGIRLSFTGQGVIYIKSIEFLGNESQIPFSRDYSSIYPDGCAWEWRITYAYDAEHDCSVFKKNALYASGWLALYIGNSTKYAPHETQNISLQGKSVIKIVYQNPTDTTYLDFSVGYANDPTTPEADASMIANDATLARDTWTGLSLQTNMAEYEWACLSVPLHSDVSSHFLSMLLFSLYGPELRIRSIETE